MRLRSHKTVSSSPRTPRTRRPSNPHKTTPRLRRTSVTVSVIESPLQTAAEDVVDYDSDKEVPMMTRRLLPRGRPRKRAIAVDDGDLAFKTPIRSILRSERVLSEIDPVTPRNSTARNIYSPIVRFLTPSKENLKRGTNGSSVLMSPEQGVFGYGSMDLLSGEEEDDVFDPFAFIKNVPSQSQHSRPHVRDIPPKTRSTPVPTLVVDLEGTLVFSSLGVIEEAEYSFYTAFQDNRYKVYMTLRPHVKEFLQAMSKHYEKRRSEFLYMLTWPPNITNLHPVEHLEDVHVQEKRLFMEPKMFVYTCAKKEYAKNILDILDPQKKLFRHRLYQEDCACVLGHYIKDLGVINRDLKKTVVLNSSPHTYPYHLMNMIPIKTWSGEPEDRELQKLIPYMEKLSSTEDFQEVLKKRKDHFHRLLSED